MDEPAEGTLAVTKTRLALLAAIKAGEVIWDERVDGWVEVDYTDPNYRQVRTAAVERNNWVYVVVGETGRLRPIRRSS